MMCQCGHHAVYHDLKGTKGRKNPHLRTDWHEVKWAVDARGGLTTDHCVGTEFTACRCTAYRPIAKTAAAPLRMVRSR